MTNPNDKARRTNRGLATLEPHPATLTVCAVLAQAKVGETVTWDRLTAALGIDSRGKGKHHVWSARRMLLRDRKMVFGAVYGVGLRLLDPEAVVGRGTHRRKKVVNQTRYARKEYDSIDDRLRELSREAAAEYQCNLALMESLRQAADGRRAAAQRRQLLAATPPAGPDDLSSFRGS